MLVPSGIHAKYPIPRNAEPLRNPRFSRTFTSKITHSIPRRPIFSAQDQRADGALGRIVGHFQSAIARVVRERIPARQSVTDRASERALGTDLSERSSKESFEIDKARDCFNLPHCHAL